MAGEPIVIALQRLAIDSDAKVSDLLRKSLLIATKLKLKDFKSWVEAELSGYGGGSVEVPKYRIVQGRLKALNPYHGMVPVQINDARTEQLMTRAKITNALPEIEDMLRTEDGEAMIKLPPEHSATGAFTSRDVRFDTYKVIARNHLIGVVETVRTMILQWALKLESEGIMGEDMTFSKTERDRAAAAPGVHIENFRGVLGDVTAHNLQMGDYASIHDQLKQYGVPQKERNELETLTDELKKAKEPAERASISQRGLDWVGRNAKNLSNLATVIRGWFE